VRDIKDHKKLAHIFPEREKERERERERERKGFFQRQFVKSSSAKPLTKLVKWKRSQLFEFNFKEPLKHTNTQTLSLPLSLSP
jgi:hypothetical protein